MKYVWVNFIIFNVINKLIGIRLLKRMMKVKKFSLKLLALLFVGGDGKKVICIFYLYWLEFKYNKNFLYYIVYLDSLGGILGW